MSSSSYSTPLTHDHYFRKILDKHVDNPHLELLVIFGKNEGNITRSISQEDLDYFAKFPNVTLIYVPTLHAKYYGNETKGVVTSINLYDYSFQNNIEFGVYSERQPLVGKLFESVGNKNIDDQAFAQVMHIAATHDVIFARRPCFKQRQGLFAKLTSSKDYLEPRVLFLAVEEVIHNRPYTPRRLDEFPKEVDFEQTLPHTLPTRTIVADVNNVSGTASSERTTHTANRATTTSTNGFCIRTGEPIPFNPSRPFCKTAYKTWVAFGDKDYPEKFCHKTGRPSYGKTSMRNPIL